MEKGLQGSGVLGCMHISPTLPCMQCGAFFRTRSFKSDIPLLFGVVGWLVGDESNRSAVNEHRFIESYGS